MLATLLAMVSATNAKRINLKYSMVKNVSAKMDTAEIKQESVAKIKYKLLLNAKRIKSIIRLLNLVFVRTTMKE